MTGGNQAFSAQQLFQAAFTHYQAGNLPEAAMWQKWQAGERPVGFAVERQG